MRDEKEILAEIRGTYACILSHLKNMPGAKIENIFPSHSIRSLKEEQEYIEILFLKASMTGQGFPKPAEHSKCLSMTGDIPPKRR